jgi:lysophospholipase L1-like esterase
LKETRRAGDLNGAAQFGTLRGTMFQPKGLDLSNPDAEERMTIRIDREIGILLLSFALALLLPSCGGGGGGSSGSPPPKAVTMPATNIRIDNVVLHGVVNPNGLATNAWFEWGIDNAALTGRSPDFPAGSGTTDNQVVFTATGLQQKTTYYFRIAAINSAGKEAQGEIRSFSTPPLPTVTTGDPTDVTTNSAKLNGEVNPNGQQTNVWFEWGTDNNLLGYSSTVPQSIGTGVSNQPVNATIFVSTGGTYYYRIAASNPEGVARGSIVSFRANQLPETTTEAATFITLNSAELNGTANPNGFETYAWFEYGVDSSLSNPSTTDNQLIGSGSTPIPLLKNIPGLTPYTTWYFRAVARNAGGTQKGAIKSFPTGEYFVAVGDSITAGTGDDISSDGIGFEPVLQNLLSTARGYPISIVNAGVGGVDSAYGEANISTTLLAYPNAKYYLILYGTNDANPFVNTPSGLGQNPAPAGSFKYNLQQMINRIKTAGKVPYLAKVPYTLDTARIANILLYNQVIDELVAANGISVPPPDFYGWFLTHQGEFADALHPNGQGYQSMANLWETALNP